MPRLYRRWSRPVSVRFDTQGRQMAGYTEHERDDIDATIGLWTERCLLADRSLVFEDRDGVWSRENVDDLYARFNANPYEGAEGGGTFFAPPEALRPESLTRVGPYRTDHWKMPCDFWMICITSYGQMEPDEKRTGSAHKSY